MGLAERWIKDLLRVGYVFLKVIAHNIVAVERSVKVRKVAKKPILDCELVYRKALEISDSDTDLSATQASEEPAFDAFKGVLLIVNFNQPRLYDKLIWRYLETYKKYFPNVVFYSSMVPYEFTPMDTKSGQQCYIVLADSMERYPGYAGYFHTNDDVVLNPRQLAKYDKNTAWKKVPVASEIQDRSKPPPPDGWSWGIGSQEYVWSDPITFTPEQRVRIVNFTGVPGPADIRAFVDAVYVPTRIVPESAPLMRRIYKNKGHLELTIGLGLVAVEPTENWVS